MTNVQKNQEGANASMFTDTVLVLNDVKGDSVFAHQLINLSVYF